MVCNYCGEGKWLQGVIKKIGSLTYLVEVDGIVWKRLVDRIRDLGTKTDKQERQVLVDLSESYDKVLNGNENYDGPLITPVTNPNVESSVDQPPHYPSRNRKTPDRYQ